MTTALLSAFLFENAIYIRVNEGVSQQKKIKLPDQRGVTTLPSNDPEALGEELKRAESWLSVIDDDGRICEQNRLVRWDRLTGTSEEDFWIGARQALVGFREDGTVNVAASQHSDEVGVYLWQKPYFTLNSPTDLELGTAVLDALNHSS